MKRLSKARFKACVYVVLLQNPHARFKQSGLPFWQDWLLGLPDRAGNVPDPESINLSRRMIVGTLTESLVLDAALERVWPVRVWDRDSVEQSLLRFGAWEILHADSPPKVVVEAMRFMPIQLGKGDSVPRLITALTDFSTSSADRMTTDTEDGRQSSVR